MLLFASLFISQNGLAQITGTVSDAAAKPLSFANVLLLAAADSSLVRGTLTSETGNYVFENVPAGTFLLSFSMLGFEQALSKTFVLNEKTAQKTVETMVLQENTSVLSEISVVAKRPFLEQQIDRTVVNVANSITSAGGTALQVLQRSPGVQVNDLTKTISLAGKQDVIVMINGKIERQPMEAVVQMLASMNADNIDRIELIHTPPANFEAEGNAGIINIILKSTGDAGLNGGYSAKIGYGNAEKYGGGGYFNYRKNRVNFFGNYDYNLNNNPQVFTNFRRTVSGNDVSERDTYSDRPNTPTPLQNARLGLDFQISKKTVVGVLGSFFDRNWYMEAESRVKYLKNGAVDSTLRMPNSETNHTRSFSGNVNFAHQFSKNQTLNFDADLIKFGSTNPSDYEVLNFDATGAATSNYQLRIRKEMPIQIAVAKADYSIDFGKNGRLETGAKITSMRFDNDVRAERRESAEDWATISDLTSVSHLDEKIAGAYTSFSLKMAEKTDLKAGLRYEFTNTQLDSAVQFRVVDRRFGSWFPSVFVSRKLSENQNLNLSYSRRTTRPTMRQLAPGFVFFDPNTVMSGNTTLKSAFTDALKLDYSLKAYRFGVSYSIQKNPIRWAPMIDPKTSRQVARPSNMDEERVASANIFMPFHPTGWWEMQNNVFVNSREISFVLEGKKFKINALEYGLNSTQTFKLPKKMSLEISGEYNSPGVWGVAKWRANGSLDIGLQKDLGSWGKLSLNASDLFQSNNWFGTTDQPDIDLYVRESWQVAERTFMLSWSNSFGNRKLKSSRQRQVGSAEEMQRI